MEPREHWRQVYEAKRPDEVSWFQASPAPSLDALDRLGAGPAKSLVDVGAGAATLADALLDRGWSDLTLVDVSEPALEASRQRLGERAGKVNWEVADIRHWRPDRTFDVWHDRAVFHFLTEAAGRTGYKRALAEGTRPGSHVVLATFAPDGPEQCSGLPVQRYDAAALAAELGGAFRMIDHWRETHVTPWGSEQSFQWCVFEKL
ncbi:MAG TPA: class I SAM-dependent methyltransferase [Sphingomicrobium sp.]|nr:class I SAM-dependent methyltransferase [Sphingomicrobium sp.]